MRRFAWVLVAAWILTGCGSVRPSSERFTATPVDVARPGGATVNWDMTCQIQAERKWNIARSRMRTESNNEMSLGLIGGLVGMTAAVAYNASQRWPEGVPRPRLFQGQQSYVDERYRECMVEHGYAVSERR